MVGDRDLGDAALDGLGGIGVDRDVGIGREVGVDVGVEGQVACLDGEVRRPGLGQGSDLSR
ncbi:MAG: hypothetical protein ABIZ72_11790 [Candidatus Limnocylindrales bacterium]